jgi:Domain of unknown function (DUF4265)
MGDEQISVHAEPAWRHRANYIISANLPENKRAEQLWARQVAEYQFELCCIPYFLFDVSLGDIVETDEAYRLTKLIERSGRFTFRIWFGESNYPQSRIIDEMVALGALVEHASANLIALDASNSRTAQAMANLLQAHENQHHLIYETGRTSTS